MSGALLAIAARAFISNQKPPLRFTPALTGPERETKHGDGLVNIRAGQY
jgi:hypothetical protein